MNWRIIDTGIGSAQENMRFDAGFLKKTIDPILHLYEWLKPSATYGHFINPSHFFISDFVKSGNCDLAKRPTGGGIVFHIADYAFSLLIPKSHENFSLNPLENYYFINNLVGRVIYQFFGEQIELLPFDNKEERGDFCMAKPTKYDLMLRGKKIGGAAQRKTKEGFLHQGSIFLGHLKESFLKEILIDSSIIELMHVKSAPLLGADWTYKELNAARKGLRETFIRIFS